MIAEKIQSVRMALGVLAGQVSEEQWEMIKMARAELSDAADTAKEMESRLQCPVQREANGPANVLGSLLGELGPGGVLSAACAREGIGPRPGMSLVIIGPRPTAAGEQTVSKEAANGQA
ncbi:MAG: hypothetical protein ACOZEN_14000 [Thermodesulfobacteriota bacterium]